MTNIKIWYVLMLAHCDNIATMSTMSTMATMQIPDTQIPLYLCNEPFWRISQIHYLFFYFWNTNLKANHCRIWKNSLPFYKFWHASAVKIFLTKQEWMKKANRKYFRFFFIHTYLHREKIPSIHEKVGIWQAFLRWNM